MMRTKLSRSLAIFAAMALALALAGCDNGASPGASPGGGGDSPGGGGGGNGGGIGGGGNGGNGGNVGGPADFDNPFHGEWIRTVPAGNVTLTIIATSATNGTWGASGSGMAAPDSGIFENSDDNPNVAEISANVHRSLRWELSSGAGAQTLTWPGATPGTDDWVFERAP